MVKNVGRVFAVEGFKILKYTGVGSSGGLSCPQDLGIFYKFGS